MRRGPPGGADLVDPGLAELVLPALQGQTAPLVEGGTGDLAAAQEGAHGLADGGPEGGQTLGGDLSPGPGPLEPGRLEGHTGLEGTAGLVAAPGQAGRQSLLQVRQVGFLPRVEEGGLPGLLEAIEEDLRGLPVEPHLLQGPGGVAPGLGGVAPEEVLVGDLVEVQGDLPAASSPPPAAGIVEGTAGGLAEEGDALVGVGLDFGCAPQGHEHSPGVGEARTTLHAGPVALGPLVRQPPSAFHTASVPAHRQRM